MTSFVLVTLGCTFLAAIIVMGLRPMWDQPSSFLAVYWIYDTGDWYSVRYRRLGEPAYEWTSDSFWRWLWCARLRLSIVRWHLNFEEREEARRKASGRIPRKLDY